jgi:hypothetical protein
MYGDVNVKPLELTTILSPSRGRSARGVAIEADDGEKKGRSTLPVFAAVLVSGNVPVVTCVRLKLTYCKHESFDFGVGK